MGALLQAGRHPGVIGLLPALGLMFLAMQSIVSTWAFIGIERFGWNEATIGATLAAYGVMFVLVQAVLVRFTTGRFGDANSLVSLSAIIGPPLMTGLFAWAVAAGGGLAGAPFMFGAVLMAASIVLAWRALGAAVPVRGAAAGE